MESKHYYIDLINSSKANQFTSFYHYSGVGFKRAAINLGIFRKTDNLLVGVLQWGTSAQMKIKLDRYVKEPIKHEEYLELNRFCMADSEGRNAESEAIALGIKWIKQNRKDIKLLVSYAGRKEGNYGYIYQATSWEYLGYFVSDGFWIVDGKETHQISLWNFYKNHCDQKKSFKDGLCDVYHQVQHFWSKQFIYIKRLDKHLTPAAAILPYPKETTDAPIVTRFETYKDEPFEKQMREKEMPHFYWEKEEMLFSRRALIRQGVIVPQHVATYVYGVLEDTAPSLEEAKRQCGISVPLIRKSLRGEGDHKQYAFRYFPSNEEPPAEIEIDYVCEIDGLKFFNRSDAANYCGVSRQAAAGAYNRRAKTLGGKEIKWNKQKARNI